ncbi:hypothetical protein ACA910_000062 [Epithemia clementina (nom. ined.)]
MMATRGRFQQLLLLVALIAHLGVGLEDKHASCEHWALIGECDKNPGYMLDNCAKSCGAAAGNSQEALKQEVGRIESFFDLQAPDIMGNMVDFGQYRGQTVIVTNVATYCGRTAAHYRGLVQLWSQLVQERKLPVNILAFPCNQFGQQEPGTAEEIMEFARQQGVQFTMMGKVDVNGPQASTVYKYLKYRTGIHSIHWNFDTYFVVNGKGEITEYSNVDTPADLLENIVALHSGDEL